MWKQQGYYLLSLRKCPMNDGCMNCIFCPCHWTITRYFFPLKCGFLQKSFIMNVPLVSCPFPVLTFRWVCCCTHPKVMTGNGQLTRGAFIINDFLRNPHFSLLKYQISILDLIQNKRKGCVILIHFINQLFSMDIFVL